MSEDYIRLAQLDREHMAKATEIAIGISARHSLLRAHFLKMQDMASRYLQPEPYVDMHGGEAQYSEPEVRDELFINDIISCLDGPGQRKAMGEE